MLNINIGNLFLKKNQYDNLYPGGDFKISKITSDEGVQFATFNHSYIEYNRKNLFPWQVKLTIETIKTVDHKYLVVEEMKILNFIENSLKIFFHENSFAHYIGRVTKIGFRDIYFYLDYSNFNDKETEELLIELNDLRNISFNIKKDESWDDISGYY